LNYFLVHLELFFSLLDELPINPVEESSLQELPISLIDLPPPDFDVIKSVEEFCENDQSSVEESLNLDPEVNYFLFYLLIPYV
jgi:hypothetical protein